MALTTVAVAAGTVPTVDRQPGVGLFLRLKLRLLRNGFRGAGWRITLAVLGAVGGAWFALTGFGVFAIGAAVSHRQSYAFAVLGGAGLMLAWLVLPLLMFGVDETLDPARFALLPIRPVALLRGLFAAALLGVPPVMTFLATQGIVLSAAVHGGVGAAVVAFVGTVAGLGLCVLLARAATTALATTLRSRRARDRASMALMLFVFGLTPLQLGGLFAIDKLGLDRLAGIGRVVAWTPLGAPYAMGLDVAGGHWLTAAARLAITALAAWLLAMLWLKRLPAAMLGATAAAKTSPKTAKKAAKTTTRASKGLIPVVLRRLPSARFAALVAREWLYWAREPRRRSGITGIVIGGIMLPLIMRIGGTMGLVTAVLIAGGMLGGLLPNQFGFDASAYAANVLAGVPGRVEIGARVAAVSVILVPPLLAAPLVIGLVSGDSHTLHAMGVALIAFGGATAVSCVISVALPYALPETTNPFAMNSGAGFVRSLVSIATLVMGTALAAPLAYLGGDLPGAASLAIGLVAGTVLLGSGILVAGGILDERAPAVLQAVTPRR